MLNVKRNNTSGLAETHRWIGGRPYADTYPVENSRRDCKMVAELVVDSCTTKRENQFQIYDMHALSDGVRRTRKMCRQSTVALLEFRIIL